MPPVLLFSPRLLFLGRLPNPSVLRPDGGEAHLHRPSRAGWIGSIYEAVAVVVDSVAASFSSTGEHSWIAVITVAAARSDPVTVDVESFVRR